MIEVTLPNFDSFSIKKNPFDIEAVFNRFPACDPLEVGLVGLSSDTDKGSCSCLESSTLRRADLPTSKKVLSKLAISRLEDRKKFNLIIGHRQA